MIFSGTYGCCESDSKLIKRGLVGRHPNRHPLGIRVQSYSSPPDATQAMRAPRGKRTPPRFVMKRDQTRSIRVPHVVITFRPNSNPAKLRVASFFGTPASVIDFIVQRLRYRSSSSTSAHHGESRSLLPVTGYEERYGSGSKDYQEGNTRD